MFLVFAVAAGVLLSLTVFFKLETIVARPQNPHYTEAELIRVSGITPGQNLLSIKSRRVEAALVDAFPYVEKADVRREFPAGIVIDVTIAKPVYALYDLGGYTLLSAGGRVLEAGIALPPEGVLVVTGMPAPDLVPGESLPASLSEKKGMLDYLREALLDVELEDIRLVDVSDRLDLKLFYGNCLVVQLGSESDLVQKLRMARYVIDETMSERTAGILYAAERPMGSIRPRNIFDPEIWPFPEELRGHHQALYAQARGAGIMPQEG